MSEAMEHEVCREGRKDERRRGRNMGNLCANMRARARQAHNVTDVSWLSARLQRVTRVSRHETFIVEWVSRNSAWRATRRPNDGARLVKAIAPRQAGARSSALIRRSARPSLRAPVCVGSVGNSADLARLHAAQRQHFRLWASLIEIQRSKVWSAWSEDPGLDDGSCLASRATPDSILERLGPTLSACDASTN